MINTKAGISENNKKSYIQIFVFSIILLFKQMLYDHNDITIGKIILLLSISVIFSYWTLLLEPKKQFFVLVILDLCISLIILCDKVYFRYYNSPISIPVLYQVGLVGSLTESIKNLLHLSDILYLIDFLIIPFIYFYLYKTRKTNSSITKKEYRQNIISLIISLVLCFSIVSYNVYKVNKSSPGLFTAIFNNNLIEQNMGVLSFHILDSYRFVNNNIFRKDNLTKSDKKNIISFFDDKQNNMVNNMYGIAKGKNLIILQVEALQGFVINRKIDGQDITPNLNKLIKNNIYFDNFYTQVAGGNTSDAEFLTNTSLYPVNEGAVYFRYPGNSYNSLPKILKKQGYYSVAMHGYDADFWNRRIMYSNLGFERFYSSIDYLNNESIGWGIGDKSFLKQSLDKLQNLPKPFYSFMITLTSHHPFDAFENDKSLNVGQFEGTQLGNYIKAIHYTDAAIGQFIQGLKESGLYDNSVIVIYGDHNAIKSDKLDELDKFLGNPKSDLTRAEYNKVPLIMHIPGYDKNDVRSIIAGQIDTLPTLLNLLGIKSTYHIGTDLLNASNNLVIFRDSSFTDGSLHYLGDNNIAYDIKSGQAVNANIYEKELQNSRKLLKISDQIITNNYLKDLLK